MFIIFVNLFLLFSSEYQTYSLGSKKYPKVKQLPNNEYFVILNDGMYIYNNNFSNKILLQEFKPEISYYYINKIVISELEDNNNIYIFSIIENDLYLLNYSIINQTCIKLNSDLNGYNYYNYYNLIPFKTTNNTLDYIIYYPEKYYSSGDNYYLLFFHYQIELFSNNNKSTLKNESKSKLENHLSYCTNKCLTCQLINENDLICIYITYNWNNGEYLVFSGFNINKNFKKEIEDYKYQTYYYYIIDIKSSLNNIKNTIFICYNAKYYYENRIYCLKYNLINGKHNIEEYKYYYINFDNFEITYLKKNNDYILFCNEGKYLYYYYISENDETESIYDYIKTDCNNINYFSLVFNNNPDYKYSLISDCEKTDYKWYILYNDLNFSINYYNNGETSSNKIFNGTKEDLLQDLNNIVQSIIIGQNYQISGDDFSLIIKPTNSSYLENSTHINFTKCESILREKLNISSSRFITFLQLEIVNKNEKSLVNQVEYQAYDDNKNLLDLSLCNDSNIQIFYALKDNTLDINYISSFQDSGIDIFNINDSFFNDICHSYSESNNDVVLEDRIKYIYQNYSLCDDGCTYNEINTENMTVSCDCKVKTNLTTNESSFSVEKLDNIDIDSNFALIKCYNLVFSFKGKLKNIGFWIFLILVLMHIPLLITYFYKGIKPIEQYLMGEMEKNGYIDKEENKKEKNIKTNNKIIYLKTKNNPPPKSNDNNKEDEQIKKNLKIIDASSTRDVKLLEKDLLNNINNKSSNITNNSKILDNDKLIIKNINENNINNNKKKVKRMKKKGKGNNKIIKFKKKKSQKSIDFLQTEGIEKKNNNKVQIKEKKDKMVNYCLININLNNVKNYIPKESKVILNNYTFEEAIKYDMRGTLEIFYIFLLSKQAIFHAFLYRSPLESFQLRLCLLIFIISSDLALNAFFYLDDKISEKYKYAKNIFLFAFNNNITIILLSTLIGFVFMTLFTNLSNSINNVRDLFKAEEEKIKKNKNYKVTNERKKEILTEIQKILKKHKIKLIILVSIEVLLMLFFWYYVTAFCHVYSSTQTSWLLDSFLSMLSRLIIIILLSLGFAKLYRISIESNFYCIYKFVLFFYCFG